MRKAMVIRGAAALLIGATIAPVAAASAQTGATATPDRARSQPQGTNHERIVFRRDGDRAVRFDPVIGAGAQTALRRDGSRAVPFVSHSGPSTANADGRFDWEDAAIGAAGAVGLMLLASTAGVAVHRRRQPRLRPSVVA